MPRLESIEGDTAVLRVPAKAGAGYLLLTMKRLASTDERGAWFLVRIEEWR